MEECHKCHVPETKAILVEVISSEGIVKVCGKCYGKGTFPLVKKDASSFERKGPSVYERMVKISGFKPTSKQETMERTQQGISLRKIVNANLERNLTDFLTSEDAKKDFIYNFHWIVMKGRRNKHITQEHLAEAIREPERVVKLIEKGYVPKNLNIIRKIENYLGVKLRKNIPENETARKPDAFFHMQENPDDPKGDVIIKDSNDLTISDLQEMKRRRDSKIAESPEKKKSEENEFFEEEIEMTSYFDEEDKER